MKILESLFHDDDDENPKGSAKVKNNINLSFSPNQDPQSLLSPYHANIFSPYPSPLLSPYHANIPSPDTDQRLQILQRHLG